MTNDEDTASARYVELVLRLRDHLAGARGWQARAATALGTHPTYISKLARGTRKSVGTDAIEGAVRQGLPREYFWGMVDLDDREIGAFLAGGDVRRRPDHDAGGGEAILAATVDFLVAMQATWGTADDRLEAARLLLRALKTHHELVAAVAALEAELAESDPSDVRVAKAGQRVADAVRRLPRPR